MRYWMRWISDFRGKTQGCSIAELGAYGVMLDEYYAHQKPIPADKNSLYRLCGAIEQHERDAVDRIASRFFVLNGDGTLHNKRADEEIAEYKAYCEKQAKHGRSGAMKRWGKK